MRKIIVLLVFTLLLYSCKTNGIVESTNYSSVIIDTLFQDKISIRALLIDGAKVWYTADNSRFGSVDLSTNQKREIKIGADTKTEFRSIAQTKKHVFILSVGNPALLYQFSKLDFSYKLVYNEQHEKVFYDSMLFWNDKEGIAVGDPIASSFSMILTKDSGKSWQKIPEYQLPKFENGEAFFAASNTTISSKNGNTWLFSGGKNARVFYSKNKGKDWKVYDTPIVKGKQMTGIFTGDFYNSKIGFIAGGNYEVLGQNFDNKALTKDAGKSWNLVAQNQDFGYTSCVQFIPNSRGKGLVSVGASGLFCSLDGGVSWKQLSTDTSLYTIRFFNNSSAIAAGRNKMVRIQFKK